MAIGCTLSLAAPGGAADLAVLHVNPHTGQPIALPLLHVGTQHARAGAEPPDQQSLRTPELEAAVQACLPPGAEADDSAPLYCPLPVALVAAQYGMPTAPAEWVDLEGHRHAVLGGIYFRAAEGDGVGFLLATSAHAAGGPGTVLTSGGAARIIEGRTLPRAAWRAWPELAAQTQDWVREDARACRTVPRCRTAPHLLADLARLQGHAVEYRLPGGDRLQMLQARTVSRSAPGDGGTRAYVAVNLWRWQGADGRALRLSGGPDALNSVERVSEACETQCPFGWDSPPQVFEWRGRIFVGGAFAGGTVHGYVFVEVLPGSIRSLGSYVWGS